MKLMQVIEDESGKHYIHKCEVCGQTITSDKKELQILCPNCVRKETEHDERR